MSSILQRSLSLFELLSKHPEGLSVKDVADKLNIPPSAAHRLLNDLIAHGYVRQDKDYGDYSLTIKMAMLGLSYLGRSGIVDIAQPILDDLATTSQELARLSIIDGDYLVWVARAQGAKAGLRYDPDLDQGTEAHLATSATGMAWLMTMSEEEAIMRVAKQGFAPHTHAPGPNAPQKATDLLKKLEAAKKRGFTTVTDSFMSGLSAMAAPVFHPRSGKVIAVVSIGGPSVRLTEEKMLSLGEKLLEATNMLSTASETSNMFVRAKSA